MPMNGRCGVLAGCCGQQAMGERDPLAQHCRAGHVNARRAAPGRTAERPAAVSGGMGECRRLARHCRAPVRTAGVLRRAGPRSGPPEPGSKHPGRATLQPKLLSCCCRCFSIPGWAALPRHANPPVPQPSPRPSTVPQRSTSRNGGGFCGC
jgi:hypothetical protein